MKTFLKIFLLLPLLTACSDDFVARQTASNANQNTGGTIQATGANLVEVTGELGVPLNLKLAVSVPSSGSAGVSTGVSLQAKDTNLRVLSPGIAGFTTKGVFQLTGTPTALATNLLITLENSVQVKVTIRLPVYISSASDEEEHDPTGYADASGNWQYSYQGAIVYSADTFVPQRNQFFSYGGFSSRNGNPQAYLRMCFNKNASSSMSYKMNSAQAAVPPNLTHGCKLVQSPGTIRRTLPSDPVVAPSPNSPGYRTGACLANFWNSNNQLELILFGGMVHVPPPSGTRFKSLPSNHLYRTTGSTVVSWNLISGGTTDTDLNLPPPMTDMTCKLSADNNYFYVVGGANKHVLYHPGDSLTANTIYALELATNTWTKLTGTRGFIGKLSQIQPGDILPRALPNVYLDGSSIVVGWGMLTYLEFFRAQDPNRSSSPGNSSASVFNPVGPRRRQLAGANAVAQFLARWLPKFFSVAGRAAVGGAGNNNPDSIEGTTPDTVGGEYDDNLGLVQLFFSPLFMSSGVYSGDAGPSVSPAQQAGASVFNTIDFIRGPLDGVFAFNPDAGTWDVRIPSVNYPGLVPTNLINHGDSRYMDTPKPTATSTGGQVAASLFETDTDLYLIGGGGRPANLSWDKSLNLLRIRNLIYRISKIDGAVTLVSGDLNNMPTGFTLAPALPGFDGKGYLGNLMGASSFQSHGRGVILNGFVNILNTRWIRGCSRILSFLLPRDS